MSKIPKSFFFNDRRRCSDTMPLRRSFSVATEADARRTCRARLEPVSEESRTSLCQRRQFLPGKGFARPETGRAFLATPADHGRQRPRYPASPAAKPRKHKDYSDRARKPKLRRSGWWARQSRSDRSPGAFSLLTGKRTGKSAKIDLRQAGLEFEQTHARVEQ